MSDHETDFYDLHIKPWEMCFADCRQCADESCLGRRLSKPIDDEPDAGGGEE